MKTNLSDNENLVLEFINKNGSLTTMQSVVLLGILNVQDVIMRLRRYGYNITKDWKSSKSQKRYAVYTLIR